MAIKKGYGQKTISSLVIPTLLFVFSSLDLFRINYFHATGMVNSAKLSGGLPASINVCHNAVSLFLTPAARIGVNSIGHEKGILIHFGFVGMTEDNNFISLFFAQPVPDMFKFAFQS